MRGTGIAAGIVLIVYGLIVADILTHPAGTQAAGNVISGVSRPAINGLLGVPS